MVAGWLLDGMEDGKQWETFGLDKVVHDRRMDASYILENGSSFWRSGVKETRTLVTPVVEARVVGQPLGLCVHIPVRDSVFGRETRSGNLPDPASDWCHCRP
jgi:hypothetical protein